MAEEKKRYDCSEYSGYYYDIELSGWNDGVSNVLILAEDEDFLFYWKVEKKRTVCGLIGKKFITSVTRTKEGNIVWDDKNAIDRNYFFNKHVVVEIASKEGIIRGFFDFRDDDYLDVIVQSFEDAKLRLDADKEISVDIISKLEELG